MPVKPNQHSKPEWSEAMPGDCVCREECDVKMDLIWEAIGKNDESGLRKSSKENHDSLTDLLSAISTLSSVARVIAWLLGFLIVAVGAYFTSLEVRGKAHAVLIAPHAQSMPERLFSSNFNQTTQTGSSFDRLSMDKERTWRPLTTMQR